MATKPKKKTKEVFSQIEYLAIVKDMAARVFGSEDPLFAVQLTDYMPDDADEQDLEELEADLSSILTALAQINPMFIGGDARADAECLLDALDMAFEEGDADEFVKNLAKAFDETVKVFGEPAARNHRLVLEVCERMFDYGDEE